MEKNETMITLDWLREHGAPEGLIDWFADSEAENMHFGADQEGRLSAGEVIEWFDRDVANYARREPKSVRALSAWRDWLTAEFENLLANEADAWQDLANARSEEWAKAMAQVDLKEKMTSAVMQAVKPILDTQTNAITTVSDSVTEVLRELRIRDDMVRRLTTQVEQLQASYQKATLELPIYLRQAPEVARFVSEIDSKIKGLEDIAFTDALTGLANRAGLQKLVNEAHDFCFYTAILDLDYFKHVNDRYGHNTGDAVLAGVAKQIQTTTGEAFPGLQTITARVGGEEVAILVEVKNTSRETPDVFISGANKIRTDIQNMWFEADGKPFSLTASIGVSSSLLQLPLSESGRRGLEMLGDADKMLYRAKAEGRNRVAVDKTALTANVDRLVSGWKQETSNVQGVGVTEPRYL
ncbi:MAG: GGDEF domain-containing protein [Dissulfurispiraceae bacterium]